MTNRRKLLIGIGSLAAGGAAAIGSGATSVTQNRDVSMNVVADSAGIVQLEAGHPEGDDTGLGLIHETSDGNLEIDLTQGGAQGLNTDSIYQIGTPTNESNDPAFTMTNQMNENYEFTFTYTFDSPSSVVNSTLQIWNSGTVSYANNGPDSFSQNAITVDGDDTSGSGTIELGPGESEYFAIRVSTEGASPSEDLSGTLTIRGEAKKESGSAE